MAASDPGHDCIFTFLCSDAFGNAGANYGGTLADPTGTDGNISEDPLFCDLEQDDYHVGSDSPCLPQNNECGVLIGANGPGCAATMDVADESPTRAPASMIVAAPNPFRNSVELRYTLTTPGEVSIRIVDPTGRVLRTLVAGASDGSGPHFIQWDGRDDFGREVARGIYFARMETGGGSYSTQVIAIR